MGSSEVIAGLGEALIGLAKGDRCMIGISPRLFYQQTSNEWVTMSERNHPTNWIMLLVEVVKMKSSDSSKEKKKEKKVKEEETVAIAPSPAVPVSVAATSVEAVTPDIKSRMARMAAASGAPQQLGDLLGGRKVSADSYPAEVAVAAEPDEPTVSAAVAVAAQPVAVLTPLVQPQQKSQAAAPAPAAPASAVISSPAPASLTPVATPTMYRSQDSILAQKEAMLQQSQDTLNQQLVNNGASPAYAVAVAAESSLMISETSGIRDRNVLMMMETSQQSQQQYFTQFQQSMMIIQQSMMQMHTKLDQVGMSVNNTFSLVQQQASAVTSANSANGAGMGNMNGMGMGMGNMNGMGMMNFGGMGMGMGGMNPMAMGGMGGMNPMMMGYGGNMNGGFNNNFGPNPVRGKVEDLVSTAQYLVQQYDQLKRENDELQNRGSSQQELQSLNSQIQQLKSYVTELEGQRNQWQVSSYSICNYFFFFPCLYSFFAFQ